MSKKTEVCVPPALGGEPPKVLPPLLDWDSLSNSNTGGGDGNTADIVMSPDEAANNQKLQGLREELEEAKKHLDYCIKVQTEQKKSHGYHEFLLGPNGKSDTDWSRVIGNIGDDVADAVEEVRHIEERIGMTPGSLTIPENFRVNDGRIHYKKGVDATQEKRLLDKIQETREVVFGRLDPKLIAVLTEKGLTANNIFGIIASQAEYEAALTADNSEGSHIIKIDEILLRSYLSIAKKYVEENTQMPRAIWATHGRKNWVFDDKQEFDWSRLENPTARPNP